MKLPPAERALLGPALDQAVRDLADLIAQAEPDVLHTLMEAVEAFARTYRHPRQIIHNGRKPRCPSSTSRA